MLFTGSQGRVGTQWETILDFVSFSLDDSPFVRVIVQDDGYGYDDDQNAVEFELQTST